ncbi:transcription repressor NadR [Peribacillus muralis]|uniref:transcription repressor NadR n=1 Tax=Peribacillus muralis TaxID=264697 RepID=UPI001F4E1E22|nr:transcription repressor NadR [Peribacillus muralis]MCK1991692.1 transcription repressor NadR [Peribacillus muralis]MCK2012250.1 transcription repressor NadR [Peribacillus muralis]
MMEKKKLRGEERRTKLLHILQTSTQPVTGSELSQMTNVSRQVIVGDITLLKARNEPIIATSQGYMFLPVESTKKPERIIACQHDPSRTQEELFLLVDIGVTVKDVKIEHPVYGDLTASIMVSSRKEVQQFLSRVSATNASFLSELTSGIHLHTVSAATENLLEEAEVALRDAGILVD